MHLDHKQPQVGDPRSDPLSLSGMIEQAAKRMHRLQAIITELASALTYEDVARATVDYGVPALGACMGAMWLLDDASGRMKLVRSHNVRSHSEAESVTQQRDLEHASRAGASATSPEEQHSPVIDVRESRGPIFIATRDELEHRYPESALGYPKVASYLWLPLVTHEKVTGVLALAFDEPRSFDLDERGFWILVGDQCAQGLYRAHIYQAEQRARAEMGLLYSLVDSISRATKLSDVYEPSLDAVQGALGASRSSILLCDEDGVMRFKAWRHLSDEYRRAIEGHSPWSRNAHEPPPILIPDVDKEESMRSFRDLFLKEGIRAIGFFPLLHHGELLGKFMVYATEPRVFTSDEIRLAQTVAGQIAQAVARKRSEAELEAASAAAEHASTMKDEFLAVVSHELRTPLASILGWAAILQTERRNDPAVLSKGLEVIERNAKAQATIIEDLLDVSRIIRGKLCLDPHPITLVPILIETIEALKTSARAKEIDVVLEADDDLFSLVGDPDRLRQIAWNLLSNAIKFTPPKGRVNVRLSRDLGAAVVLEVRDTGMGIAPDLLPYVFDRFRQADSTTTRRHGGLGLGLSIVRHLVELHGGHVSVKSPGPGKGTTFIARFPVRAVIDPMMIPVPPRGFGWEDAGASATGVAASPQHLLDLSGVHVLVVDDLPDAREMLKEALSSYGAVVDVAGSAGEAVELLKTGGAEVLVTDIGMPDVDGFALLRSVRAMPGRLAHLPAVAITAYARSEDVRRARDAGFQAHVAKPTRPETLAHAVARALPADHAMHAV